MSVRVVEEGGVAYVTIDAPPLNHFNIALAGALRDASRRLQRRRDLKVVVFQSDVPGFFVPHLDLSEVGALPVPPRPVALFGLWTMSILAHLGMPGRWLVDRLLSILSPYHVALSCVAKLPQITIATIEGRVGGIGSELALCMDMRFGTEATVVNQLEAAFGVFPGAGGTQRLPLLIGTGPAMEMVASSTDIDGRTAECWGYLNRLLPADELRPFVQRLATRIAGFPADGLRLGKALVHRASTPSPRQLQLEAIGFMKLMISPAGRSRVERFVATGGQEERNARDLERILANVSGPDTKATADRRNE